jgi:hypothetical protein
MIELAIGRFGRFGNPDITWPSAVASFSTTRTGKNREPTDSGAGTGKAENYGIAIMARKKPHLGSSFESWLEDAGIREEVTAAAIKAVIARQLASPRNGSVTPVHARSIP